MKYINLEVADSLFTYPLLWVIWGVIAVAFIVLLVKGILDGYGPFYSLVMVFFALIFGGITLAGFGQWDMQKERDLRSDQLHTVHAQIEDRYGIDLTGDELDSLDYPRSEPSRELEAYGSFLLIDETSSGNGFTQRKIALIWQDGKMVLGQSTNGEDFTPLKTKR